MMGQRVIRQETLFYGFSLEDHVPADCLVRSIDRFVELSSIRRHLEPCYSTMGRHSIDPDLMIRMLLIGYCCGICSERRLCPEVHLNLAYRWFCRLARPRRGGARTPIRQGATLASEPPDPRPEPWQADDRSEDDDA